MGEETVVKAKMKVVEQWSAIQRLAKRLGVEVFYCGDYCTVRFDNRCVYEGQPTWKTLEEMLEKRLKANKAVWEENSGRGE